MLKIKILSTACLLMLFGAGPLWASSTAFNTLYSYSEQLKPVDSVLRVGSGTGGSGFLSSGGFRKTGPIVRFPGEKNGDAHFYSCGMDPGLF